MKTAQMVKKFFSYYRPHRKLFALDIVCSVLVSLCNLVYPFIAKAVINTYVPDRNLVMIVVLLGILLGVYVIKMFLNFIIQFWGHVLGVRIQGDMRSVFFRHVQRLPFPYFDTTKTGTIMSRMINDLFEVSELAHHGPEDLLTSVITIIGTLIALLTVNPWLSLTVLAVLPFMIWFAIKARVKRAAAFAKSRAEIGEVNAIIESSVSGVRVAKAYTAEHKEQEKFEHGNRSFMRSRAAAYKYMGIFSAGLEFFGDLLYLVALLAGGLFFYFERIDIGDFFAYVLFVSMLLTPVRALVRAYEQIQDGMTGFQRFCEVMELPPEADSTGAVDAGVLRGDIAFVNVAFSYKTMDGGDTERVIDGLNLTIPAGKTVALVGPSGGGKTTICHLIPRFYEIQSGTILIDGVDNRSFTRESLRRNVAIVAQDVFLFSGTVRDNIAYGKDGATDDEILAAAQRAGVDDFVSKLKDGYDTYVGERGVMLSGGQKQRISIARAFLKNPPILILDEATSALDNATEAQVQASLEKLSVGRTTIIVAHRLSTVKNADEIVVIGSEGVLEHGTHERLMQQQDGVYRSLYASVAM